MIRRLKLLLGVLGISHIAATKMAENRRWGADKKKADEESADTEHRQEWYNTIGAVETYISLFPFVDDPAKLQGGNASDAYCDYGTWEENPTNKKFPGYDDLMATEDVYHKTCGEYAGKSEDLCYIALFNVSKQQCTGCVFAVDVTVNNGLREDDEGRNFTFFAKLIGDLSDGETQRNDSISLPKRRYQKTGINYNKTTEDASQAVMMKEITAVVDHRAFLGRGRCNKWCHCDEYSHCSTLVNEKFGTGNTAVFTKLKEDSKVLATAGLQFCLTDEEPYEDNAAGCEFEPSYTRKFMGGSFKDCEGLEIGKGDYHKGSEVTTGLTRKKLSDNIGFKHAIINKANTGYDAAGRGCPLKVAGMSLFAYRARIRKLPSFNCVGFTEFHDFTHGTASELCRSDTKWNHAVTLLESYGTCGDNHGSPCPMYTWTAIQLPSKEWQNQGGEHYDKQEAASYDDIHCGGCFKLHLPFHLNGPDAEHRDALEVVHYGRVLDVIHGKNDTSDKTSDNKKFLFIQANTTSLDVDYILHKKAIKRQMKEAGLNHLCVRHTEWNKANDNEADKKKLWAWHWSRDGQCDKGYVLAFSNDPAENGEMYAIDMGLHLLTGTPHGITEHLDATKGKGFVSETYCSKIPTGGATDGFKKLMHSRMGLVPRREHCPLDCPVD